MERPSPGELGWCGLALGIVTFDILSPETLSSAFRKHEPYSALFMGYTCLHLLGVLPEPLDAFKSFTRNADE